MIFRLDHSRAQRIVWLLEELNLDYEIKYFKRTKEYRAPPELEKVHPLGKSPVVEVYQKDSSSPIVLAETGHIISYIISHYDTNKKLTPKSESGQELVDYYYHFTEGSFQAYLVSLLIGVFAKQKSPWVVRFLVNKVIDTINQQYYLTELIRSLNFLESQLAKKNGGYFVGDKLTGADIILSFPVYECIFNDLPRAKEIIGDADLKKLYLQLSAWSELISQEPLYVKALEKTNQGIKAKV